MNQLKKLPGQDDDFKFRRECDEFTFWRPPSLSTFIKFHKRISMNHRVVLQSVLGIT